METSAMGTEGNYSTWHFEDWEEVFEDYDDGDYYEEWIKKNCNWWFCY
jgi:hypothetical protein